MPFFHSRFCNSLSFSSCSGSIVCDAISSKGVVRSFTDVEKERKAPSEERKGPSVDSARVKIRLFVFREDWESQVKKTPPLRPVLNNIRSAEIQIDDLN